MAEQHEPVAGDNFLATIFDHLPLQEAFTGKATLLEQLQMLRKDGLSRIMRMAVTDAAHYGWALDNVHRVDQIFSSSLYLLYQQQIPECFMDMGGTKSQAKRYGQKVRRFFMSYRLDPDTVVRLGGISDAAVFLIAAKELILGGDSATVST